jgi:IS5 family transposase
MKRVRALSERSAKRLTSALDRAWHIAHQKRGDKGYLYSWYAPELECISKGKARAPNEFGCKVSIATNLPPAKGGHFILQARALHGNPYDGHTLQGALDEVRDMVSRSPLRAAVDQGYKGAPAHRSSPHCGEYLRAETRLHRQDQTLVKAPRGCRTRYRPRRLLGRNWLKGRLGDSCNALLAAAGFQSPATPPLPEQCLLFFARVFLCALGRLRHSFANPGHSVSVRTWPY